MLRFRPDINLTALGLGIALCGAPALAQDRADAAPVRTRVALGPQLVPSYPGADGVRLAPFVDVSKATGDAPFVFEAADESFGVPLLSRDGFSVGPALGFEGRRRSRDVGGLLPAVGTTVEVGGYAQYQLAPPLRLRMEVRQGIGGHKGLIANVGADYVVRHGDDWLLSVGPRVTLSNGRYNRAYYGVSPTDALVSGLPAYDIKAGVQAAGVVASYSRQLTPTWGVYGYAKYDRLVGDAADSPVVARYGSRSQPSAGLALTYTFTRRR